MIKFFLSLTFFSTVSAFGQTGSEPVITVKCNSPTAEKPQSKLWFDRNEWWALLPQKNGPSLWQRTSEGWKEHPEATSSLTGLPGRADVWAEPGEVTAVAMTKNKASILRFVPDGASWVGKHLADLPLDAAENSLQCATIARDKSGRWWVGANDGTQIFVWSSADGVDWTPRQVLAEGLKEGAEMSLLSALADGVAMIWSDQNADRMVMQRHVTGAPLEDWEAEEIIQSGNKTADDHLKAVLAADGTLWLATKSSSDQRDAPLLVLRKRSPSGEWVNLPYATLTADHEPTRPAIFLAPDAQAILLGHTIYNKPDRTQSFVEFGLVDENAAEILTMVRRVIRPDASLKSKDPRDITGPKGPFPADGPWIILASDYTGKIYEADLRPLTGSPDSH